MKSLFKVLAALLITIIVASSCANKPDSERMIGKWQNNASTDAEIVVEFTKDMQWMFYKNDELLEKGIFELKEGQIVLKHTQKEHEHDGHKCTHEHKKTEDNVMDYIFESDKQLKMGHENKMSTYKRL